MAQPADNALRRSVAGQSPPVRRCKQSPDEHTEPEVHMNDAYPAASYSQLPNREIRLPLPETPVDRANRPQLRHCVEKLLFPNYFLF